MANLTTWLAPYTGLMILFLTVCVLALAGLAAWQVTRLRAVERRYASLLTGSNGGSLQEVLEGHMAELRSAMCQIQEVETRTRQMERSSRQHVQHLSIMRYNPFRETGGDQSFVLALADENGNGAVLSSMHSRDVTRVYAKPLAGWSSPYPLTEEEAESLRKAREK